MWRFLRFQRVALLWSVALHLVLGALLLMSAHFTPPKIHPDQRPRVVKARLVSELARKADKPPAQPVALPTVPPRNSAAEQQRQAAETARVAAAQRQQAEDAARRAAERERQIEQQRQAAEITRADAARAEAAQRDAEAAAAKRLAVEQQRQAAAAEITRQRQITEEAARAVAERERQIEQQRQAVEIAQAEAAQRQQAEDAERERQIEQQRQAAEIARLEAERQQKLAEEKEAENMIAVETQRFTDDLARQQREQNRETDLLAALESEELAQEVGRYTPAIQDRVRQFWIRPLATARDLVAIVSLRVIPGGDVVPNSVRIVESSGNAAFDQSVLAAVYQASPLPVPTGAAFERFRDFDFTFSAE